MRAAIRALVKDAPLRALTRVRDQLPSLVVLGYHRILPRESAEFRSSEPGMVVSSETFEAQLDWMIEKRSIVRLSDWLRWISRGESTPTRAVALTFDDGWRDNLEFALPLMRARDVPFTLFLPSTFPDRPEGLWTTRFGRLVMSGALASAEHASVPASDVAVFAELRRAPVEQEATSISNAIARLKSAFQDEVLIGFVDRLEARASDRSLSEREFLDASEMREVIASGLCELGSHTRTHMRLRPEVSRSELEEEIVQSRRDLKERFETRVDLFSYPNGEYDVRALDLVRAHYVGAVTTHRGRNTSRADPHQLRRVGLHEDISATRHAFEARLSGVR